MAGLVLAVLVYPALSFPNGYPKLPESMEFKGEGILLLCSFAFSHLHIHTEPVFEGAVHVNHYYNNTLYFIYKCFLYVMCLHVV